jgi:hypothetical protein
VGSPTDTKAACAGCEEGRERNGLQHKSGGAGAAPFAGCGHIEEVVARSRRDRGPERKGLGAERCARDLGPAERGCGQHRGQMLRSQAGLRASGAEALDREGSPGDCRQRQGRTQDLATAFPMRSVDDDAVGHAGMGSPCSCDQWPKEGFGRRLRPRLSPTLLHRGAGDPSWLKRLG